MKQYFIPYDIAKELKEIGFEEDCIYHFKHNEGGKHTSVPTFEMKTPFGANHNHLSTRVSAPLYDQVIDWLERIHALIITLGVVRVGENEGHSEDIKYFADITDVYGRIWKSDTLPISGSRYETLNNAIIYCINKIKQKQHKSKQNDADNQEDMAP